MNGGAVTTSPSGELVLEGGLTIRNEPVQARSTARLAALLDAAASAIDELGYERLTTAMVAERAGASIGTVYRYFPDRIAVLQALAARNFERVSAQLAERLSDESHQDWVDVMSSAFEVFVEAFRNEPGFRSLRVGDVLDLRPATSAQTYNSRIADQMLQAIVSRFEFEPTAEVRVAFECAIEVTDAVVSRAFARDDNGDQAFLEQGRAIVYGHLSQYFGARQR